MPPSEPQFSIKVDPDSMTGVGTKLFFNGEEVKNIFRVEATNRLEAEDAKRSTLIIELIEVVTVN